VLADEGGNDDDPRDPGGRTSRGIQQREWDTWRKTHAGLPADVFEAPQDQIEAIYRAEYWDRLRCDDLPPGVDYCVFDYGVNSGPSRSAKELQKLLGVAQDGEIGPITVAAAAQADAHAIVERMCADRLAFLRDLKTWAVYGNGWNNRVGRLRTAALKMADSAPKPAPNHHRSVKETPVSEQKPAPATTPAHASGGAAGRPRPARPGAGAGPAGPSRSHDRGGRQEPGDRDLVRGPVRVAR
jgi:lysozyme family protein